jgi:diguanylate cyclase (GGDEF)-like protein
MLLIEVAQRLRASMREMDSVARFGGDEFVVMLCELDEDKQESVTHATRVAEKILAALSESYEITVGDEKVVHRCTASIGVCMFINHEASQEELLKWADMAMYQAKEAGRNTIRIYNSEG